MENITMLEEIEDNLEELEKTNNPKGALIRTWAPIAGVGIILASIWSMGWFDYFSLSSLIQHRETLAGFVAENFLLGLIGFILLYAALVAISFPGASLLTVLSGFLFGGIVGGISTVFAATLGAVLIFSIAKSSFGKTLEDRAGGFVKKMSAGFQENAFEYLLTLRLTPLFPFWVMNIVPALLNMRLIPYAIATFIGIIPGTLAYAYIGSGLDSVIAAQEAASPGCAAAGTCEINLSALITTDIIIAMIGLGLVSLLPVVVRKYKARKNAA